MTDLKLHSANRALIHGGEDWESKILNSTLFGPNDSEKYFTPNLVHRAETRGVSCMVHGMISFNHYIWSFIDTKHCQRLRNLTQLGNLFYVFPAADFSRFEHSIGVAHMADVFCRKAFDKGGRRGLGLAERDYLHESLIIAGLCHDLGHGPFSHTFDGLVIPRLAPNIKWSHEDASEMLLDDMIDTYHIDIDSNQVRFIKGLISGERKVNYEIDWIYEVISSKKYGMDVDRFDYMMRDPLHMNQKDLVFHPNIYMDNFEIVENSIVFNVKIANKIFEFFNHRYKLFKNMYLNRKSIGFDYMVADLFELVNPEFKFQEMIYDPKQYMMLNNHIMSDIERIGHRRKDVSQLVDRFYHRENYKFVNEYIYGKPTKLRHSKEELLKIKDLFLQCQPTDSDFRLTAENTIIGTNMFKYCENNQFDTIQVLDFDGVIKKASTLTNLMNIPFYNEYHIHCYVKDRKMYDLAKKTWVLFFSKYEHVLRIN